MLAIYAQLIPRHNTLRKPLYFVIAFTAGSALVALFSDTFWCGPDPSVNWYGAGLSLMWRVKDTADLSTQDWRSCGDLFHLHLVFPIPHCLVSVLYLRSFE